jgi:hypothetical protein
MANDYLSDEKRYLDAFEAMKCLPFLAGMISRKRITQYALFLEMNNHPIGCEAFLRNMLLQRIASSPVLSPRPLSHFYDSTLAQILHQM